MTDRQSRLNRWGAKVMPSRPKGELKTCKLVAKLEDNKYLYVMLDDDNMVCVTVPVWYREELKGKHEYVNLCMSNDEWIYHSIKEES